MLDGRTAKLTNMASSRKQVCEARRRAAVKRESYIFLSKKYSKTWSFIKKPIDGESRAKQRKAKTKAFEKIKSEVTSSENDVHKTEKVRRSNRVRSVSVVRQRFRGYGLVKTPKCALKTASAVNKTQSDSKKIAKAKAAQLEKFSSVMQKDKEVEIGLKEFVHIRKNLYLTARKSSKKQKIEDWTCNCSLTPEEIGRGEFGCGERCWNRVLKIECGNCCTFGDRCNNKKFQKLQCAPVEVFKTDKKGLGLRATADIPQGEFIIEYMGEVLDYEELCARADNYSKQQNNHHHYFMELTSGTVIDASAKGNISRFANHSCDANAKTQKWTVNGELRIGLFSKKTILAGEEITFDYKFHRFGKKAQECYCEASTCRGWLGEKPPDEDDEDEGDETQIEIVEVDGEDKLNMEIKSFFAKPPLPSFLKRKKK